jgi:hypothetical protein
VRQGLSGKHNGFVETLLKANLLPRSPLALRSASTFGWFAPNDLSMLPLI